MASFILYFGSSPRLTLIWLINIPVEISVRDSMVRVFVVRDELYIAVFDDFTAIDRFHKWGLNIGMTPLTPLSTRNFPPREVPFRF